MKVFVYPTPQRVKGRVCALLDALRATCTLTTALENGASWVKMVNSRDKALRYKGKAILAGERGGVKIDGFDLGNSPYEFTRERVEGRGIVMTTSNGSRAFEMLSCDLVVAVSFPNLPAAAEFLKKFDEVHVLCSGTDGKFSLEDFLLAGKIASLDEDPKDAARVAKVYANSVEDIFSEVMKSSHAKKLIELGFEKDVKFCSEVGTQRVVPILDGERFVRAGERI